MKNLDKLWELWSGGDCKLVIELIKGQGLDIKLVLLDFWNNRVLYEKEEGRDIAYKNTSLGQSGIGITSVPDDFMILVYLDAKDDSYHNDSCFITDDCDMDDAWITESGTILCHNTFEEAEQAALEYFIKLIESDE